MKVRHARPVPAVLGRIAATLAAALVVTTLISPAPAHAITRDEVVARAASWVRMRVGYSQRAYFEGYRRDCSGLVSMAWRLSTSLTSRTISSRAKRIPLTALQPGDAILTPGHVQIFVGWASGHRVIVLEESNSAHGAVRRVKDMPRRAVALRYRGITEPVLVAVAPTPPAPAPDAAAAAATVVAASTPTDVTVTPLP